MSWVLVGLGGALGAVARHGVQTAMLRWPISSTFPLAIFIVNVTGSLLIGILAGAMASLRLPAIPELRLFLMVGVLGGFTTFSSFSLDTLVLLRSGHTALAVANVAGQVVLSLLAAAVGYRLAS